jgi:uncharacterized protein (DUF2147 family)
MRRFAILRSIHLNTGYTMLHRPRDVMRTFILFGLFATTSAAPALAADPTGDWKVADGVAHIRVAECSGNMWGVVAWEQETGGFDDHNPDVSKRTRPTLGMPILINMKKKASADQWEGEVYNAKDGKTYSSTIKPIGSDKLEIQGCVLGFLCGGETWTRVAGPIPPSPAASVAKGAKTPVAPKTTGTMTATTSAAPKPSAQKQAAGSPPSPPDVGDICLIPDVARFTH